MSLRLLSFSVLISLICGFLILFSFVLFSDSDIFNPGPLSAGKGCIILTVDEFQDDHFVRESLDHLDLGTFISESSQEVFLDDFGELKKIPLYSFQNAIEALDPRNDGYAEQLSAFFVRDGKRFFFLPLDDPSGISTGKLTDQLVHLLEDIPFNLVILGEIIPSPFFLFFALYAAASVITLFLSGSRKLFVYNLPVLLAFGFAGIPAFFIAAALSGIWELMREPLAELFAFRRYKRHFFDFSDAGIKSLGEHLRPFRLNIVLIFSLLVLLIVHSVTSGLPVIPIVFGAGCFFFLHYLALRIVTRRFTPVSILSPKKTFSLFPFLLPLGSFYILSLFLALILPFFSYPARDKDALPDSGLFDVSYVVRPEDYYRHLAFQSSFSYTPLGREQEPVMPDGYLRYYLGEDGLISGGRVFQAGEREIPPFPLETLMGFLIHYYQDDSPGREKGIRDAGPDSVPAAKVFDMKEWIFVAIIFILMAASRLQHVK